MKTKNTAQEDGGVIRLSKKDDSDNSIKQQIAQSVEQLNNMVIVASINESIELGNKQSTLTWLEEKLGGFNKKILRENFGEVIFDRKRISKALSYTKTNYEKIGLALVPKVVEKGIQIGFHKEHKGRDYDTVTFGAPVSINGVRGNMAVVVRKADANYFKVHRLVMPDGTQFILDKKRNIAETAGGVKDNSSLSPTVNISNTNIPKRENGVNNNSMQNTPKNSPGRKSYKSERFNENNPDIRFSRKLSAKSQQVLDENPEFAEEMNEYWADAQSKIKLFNGWIP